MEIEIDSSATPPAGWHQDCKPIFSDDGCYLYFSDDYFGKLVYHPLGFKMYVQPIANHEEDLDNLDPGDTTLLDTFLDELQGKKGDL